MIRKQQCRSYVLGALFSLGLSGLGAGCASVRSNVLPAPPDPYTAAAESRALNVRVKLESGGESSIVGETVQRAVEARLAEEGFRIVPGIFDIEVMLRVGVEPFDISGNYYRFDGSVEATVDRAVDGRLLGRRTLSARNDRQLGHNPALQALSGQLARETADFVAQTLAPTRADLAVEEITVRRGLFARADAAYKHRFVDRVGRLDGVVSCRLTDENLSDREMTFRVIYFRERFPAGLLNRIRLIPELGLSQQ